MTKEYQQTKIFKEGVFHILFWLLIIHFVFDIEGLFYSFYEMFSSSDVKVFDEAFLLLPISIGLFYLNHTILIPRILNHGKWMTYCICLLLSYVLACLGTFGIYELLYSESFVFRIAGDEILDYSIGLYLQILIASTALGIGKMAFKNLLLKREAETKQKEAELKYLSNQFSPHFLHNTLNGIYSKSIEENAPQTSKAIIMLSSIMRYPINQALSNTVPLIEEVNFIEDYIALQRLRIGEDYPLSFEKEGDLNGVNILPLSLIVLVENAFKYGVSPKNQNSISFYLEVGDDDIRFSSENQTKLDSSMSSHNIGLDNLNSRLRLIYQDDYELKTNLKGDRYFVSLKLKKIVNNRPEDVR